MSIVIRKIHNLLYPKRGYILMLHSVAKSPGDSYLVVTTDALEKAVCHYSEQGYEAISMDEVSRRVAHRDKRPFVCYTFDDGYLDTYTLAYPILKARRIPFCVYMTRDFYRGEKKPHWNPEIPMMGEKELLALASDPLCTIGAHACSHPHLSAMPVDEQRRELADSKSDLEQLIGKEVKHLAYPYGDCDRHTLRLVKHLGFETAVTTSGRPVRSDARLLQLDRVTFTE